MAVRDDLKLLKRGLKTQIDAALSGGCRQSVVLLLREDRLPMARITDAHGKITSKVLSLVDLLSLLDDCTTVSQLRHEATRTTDLPPLPENTLLASVTERPSGRSFVLTGYVEPESYVFLVAEDGESHTFDISLPHLVYRAVYDEQRTSLAALSIAVCSPELSAELPTGRPCGQDSGKGHNRDRATASGPPASYRTGRPEAGTRIFRYPFSNVYHTFGGVSEGVCWPGMQKLSMEASQIPEEAVKRFLRTENNADLYGRGLSHNSPYTSYTRFLAAVEQEGGVREDYLIPTGMTVQDLHYQHDNQQ